MSGEFTYRLLQKLLCIHIGFISCYLHNNLRHKEKLRVEACLYSPRKIKEENSEKMQCFEKIEKNINFNLNYAHMYKR